MPLFGTDPENSRLVLLRPSIFGGVWLIGALLAGVLLWQHLVGWPWEREFRLKIHADGGAGPGPRKTGVPRGAPSGTWDTAFARVQEDGADLPRYADLRRLDAQNLSHGGCFIKGSSVFVAPREGATENAANHRFTVRLPWMPERRHEVLFWGAFLLLSALLWWARHPVLIELLGRWREWTARGLPPVPVALALLALAVAVAVRLRGFSVPFWDGDTRDYLKPALLFMQGHPLEACPDRPLGYPLAAWLFLRIIPDFRTLIFAHGISTLATGALLAIVIWLAGARLFAPGGWRLLSRFAAIAAFGLFTLNEDIIEREWALLPEAWACIYMAVQLILAWRISSAPHLSRRLLLEHGLFCAAGWAIFLTKPNWGLALALLPLPLGVAAAMRSATRAQFWKWMGAGIAIAAAVSAAALEIQNACTPTSTAASLELRSRVLVLWHLPLVRPEIARRLEQNPNDRYAPVLRELARLLDDEVARAKTEGPNAYPLLGYDPDHILYIGFRSAFLYHTLPAAEGGALCRELFLAGLRRNPGWYFQKVVRQASNLGVHPYGPALIYLPRLEGMLKASQKFLDGPHAYLPEPIANRYRERLDQAGQILSECWPTPPRLGLSIRMTILFGFLTLAFRWAILIPMVVCAAAAWTPRWRQRVPWAALAPVLTVAAWSIGSAFLGGLTCSISQAFEIQRYLDLFFPLSLLSELLWPLIAVAVLGAGGLRSKK